MLRPPPSSWASRGTMAPCPGLATTVNFQTLLVRGQNHHDRTTRRKTRHRPFAAMDRPHPGGLRHRYRAAGERPACDAVPGDRRAEAGRRGAMDHALVPGAAGVSDVAAQPRRPPDPRRFPAAGATAAPDGG